MVGDTPLEDLTRAMRSCGVPALAADRVYSEIDLLVDVIAGQAEPLITAVDGLRAVEVAEAVMESIKTKRWVRL